MDKDEERKEKRRGGGVEEFGIIKVEKSRLKNKIMFIYYEMCILFR